MQDLQPIYDSRASFYGKAQVIENPDVATGDEHVKVLLSYKTTVAATTANGKAKVFGAYSATTLRHIKEFLLQNGFKAESKQQILKDYGDE
jgi:hypothetical protein